MPADIERLQRIVADVAARMGKPAPDVQIARPPYVIGLSVNVFRPDARKVVLVGEALAASAPDAVLTGLIAHELGHLRARRDWRDIAFFIAEKTLYLRVVACALLIGASYADYRPLWIRAVVAMWLLALAAMLVSQAIQRQVEYECDDDAAAAVGADVVAGGLRWVDEAIPAQRLRRVLHLGIAPVSDHPAMGRRLRRLAARCG